MTDCGVQADHIDDDIMIQEAPIARSWTHSLEITLRKPQWPKLPVAMRSEGGEKLFGLEEDLPRSLLGVRTSNPRSRTAGQSLVPGYRTLSLSEAYKDHCVTNGSRPSLSNAPAGRCSVL